VVIGKVLWKLSSEGPLSCGRQCVADTQCVAIEIVRKFPGCTGYAYITGSGPTKTGAALYYVR